jgi:hypothetical protein
VQAVLPIGLAAWGGGRGGSACLPNSSTCADVIVATAQGCGRECVLCHFVTASSRIRKVALLRQCLVLAAACCCLSRAELRRDWEPAGTPARCVLVEGCELKGQGCAFLLSVCGNILMLCACADAAAACVRELTGGGAHSIRLWSAGSTRLVVRCHGRRHLAPAGVLPSAYLPSPPPSLPLMTVGFAGSFPLVLLLCRLALAVSCRSSLLMYC